MKSNAINPSPWTTASFGGTADTSPMELSALGDHLGHCRDAHGKLFAFQCLAERAHGFVSARFVTSLVVIILLIGASTLIS